MEVEDLRLACTITEWTRYTIRVPRAESVRDVECVLVGRVFNRYRVDDPLGTSIDQGNPRGCAVELTPTLVRAGIGLFGFFPSAGCWVAGRRDVTRSDDPQNECSIRVGRGRNRSLLQHECLQR